MILEELRQNLKYVHPTDRGAIILTVMDRIDPKYTPYTKPVSDLEFSPRPKVRDWLNSHGLKIFRQKGKIFVYDPEKVERIVSENNLGRSPREVLSGIYENGCCEHAFPDEVIGKLYGCSEEEIETFLKTKEKAPGASDLALIKKWKETSGNKFDRNLVKKYGSILAINSYFNLPLKITPEYTDFAENRIMLIKTKFQKIYKNMIEHGLNHLMIDLDRASKELYPRPKSKQDIKEEIEQLFEEKIYETILPGVLDLFKHYLSVVGRGFEKMLSNHSSPNMQELYQDVLKANNSVDNQIKEWRELLQIDTKKQDETKVSISNYSELGLFHTDEEFLELWKYGRKIALGLISEDYNIHVPQYRPKPSGKC